MIHNRRLYIFQNVKLNKISPLIFSMLIIRHGMLLLSTSTIQIIQTISFFMLYRALCIVSIAHLFTLIDPLLML